MKIIDKINAAVDVGEPFYSFEYFPPKTAAGVENLWVSMMSVFQLTLC
jgi:methylenetetrahydrofolate reductase (NADPH)